VFGGHVAEIHFKVEVLFKAKSARRTRHLTLRKDMKVSVQWAEKGSYRTPQLLAYLARWLEPWSDARLRASDYRILFLDVARSHIAEEVTEFAWARGYFTLFHYGCTTGVAQVNDTDLHADFQRVYMDFELEAFHNKQLYDPGCIQRTMQEVLSDVCRTWQVLDHRRGVAGHLRNGLSNRLDGTQDDLLGESVLPFWKDAGMESLRAEAKREVEARVKDGLTLADWATLVTHPADAGVLRDEGDELEAPMDPSDLPYLTDAEIAKAAVDDQDITDRSPAPEQPVVQVAAAPGDEPADVADAQQFIDRLNHLKRVRAEAFKLGIPAAVNQIDREISQIERGRLDKSAAKRKANDIARRHLAQQAEKEAEHIRKQRREAFARRRNADRVKRALRKTRVAKTAKAKAKAEEKLKQDALPKTFSAKDCGNTKAGTKARTDCLQRLSLHAPALPPADKARWPHVRDEYARLLPKIIGEPNVGAVFVGKIQAVIKELGSYYGGGSVSSASAPSASAPSASSSPASAPPRASKKAVGNPHAFRQFFNEMQLVLPKANPALHVVLM
jgi:hypothetical protein